MKPFQPGRSDRRSSSDRIGAAGEPSLLPRVLKFLVMGVALAPQVIPACSVPVFRYALERWPAAPYQLSVVCEGQLDDRRQGLLAPLSGNQVPRETFANLTVRTLDPRGTPLAALPGSLEIPPPGSLPALVLQYPEEAAARGVVWSGPFSESNLRQLLDSPLRRQIVQRLVQGDTAVWVLLESGDAEQDNATARLLQIQIEHSQRPITLPTLETGGTPAESAIAHEWKATFSLIRLARNDPAEELLVRLLLGSEDDLNDTREPMAFPIYGRGRVLYALVGKGITPETVREACAFLTGPCSCVIKELNPGLDLLLSADWDRLVRPVWTSSDEFLRLTGTVSPEGEGDTQGAGSPPIRGPRKAAAMPLDPPADFEALVVFMPSLTLMGGLGTLVLAIGCYILWRKRD
jgi:hypothetical protein